MVNHSVQTAIFFIKKDYKNTLSWNLVSAVYGGLFCPLLQRLLPLYRHQVVAGRPQLKPISSGAVCSVYTSTVRVASGYGYPLVEAVEIFGGPQKKVLSERWSRFF